MNTAIGVMLALVGGVMVGNCMVPLTFVRRWRWENAWIVFSLVALVILPWTLAFLLVPNLLAVYSSLTGSQVSKPFFYGMGWGIAQVLFGLSVVRVGMALAFAITIGLSAALGTLVPIIIQHPKVLITSTGSVLIIGLLLMFGGVFLCSRAGRLRELSKSADAKTDPAHTYLIGMLLAIGAGLLAPMLNYSLAFGESLANEAIRQGAASANAPYAVWPIALAGGVTANLAYAVYLLFVNRSWKYFFPIWPDLSLAALMGLLWAGSVAAYGMATTYLGLLGASIGWSLFQICIIFTANVSGLIAGEWRGASAISKQRLWLGLTLLGLATLFVAYGGH